MVVSVTFSTKDFCDLFIQKSAFISRSRNKFRRNPSSLFTFIIVFDAPYELLAEALSHCLSKYGSVYNIRRSNLHGYDGIQNGTRVVKMDLVESIPSFLRFGHRLVRVKHEGQVPTCRKCHLPDHVARACPNIVCFNCEELGHTFRDCPDLIKCGIFKEDGLYAVDCSLSWWRRPVSVAVDDDDEDNPPPPVTQPPADVSSDPSVDRPPPVPVDVPVSVPQ